MDPEAEKKPDPKPEKTAPPAKEEKGGGWLWPFLGGALFGAAATIGALMFVASRSEQE